MSTSGSVDSGPGGTVPGGPAPADVAAPPGSPGGPGAPGAPGGPGWTVPAGGGAVPPPPPPSPFAGLGRAFDAALGRGLYHVTRRALGPYQTAIVRIGFAFTWLFFLLREFPHRHELYGPDSPWGLDLAERLLADNNAFTILTWSDSRGWFEAVYLLTMAVCVGLLLGWRTRAMSVFFMIGVLSLQNRSVFMGDGGDNVIHLMAIYLVVTRCGQVWSLDARRRARRETLPGPDGHDVPGPDRTGVALWFGCGLALALATGSGDLGGWIWPLCLWGLWLVHALWWVLERHWPGEPRLVCDVIGNVVHNTALLLIMAQVCIIYATAGWYKIQGSRWQDGTAVYYPLNLDYFTPFPALSDALGGNGTAVMLMSYGTVLLQVAFPFALLNRKVKNVFLAVMISEHIGIAVLMGLPFFSMAMIAMDIVFLPTAFLLWIGYRTRRATDPLRRLRHRLPSRRAPEAGPADGGRAPDGTADGGRPAADPAEGTAADEAGDGAAVADGAGEDEAGDGAAAPGPPARPRPAIPSQPARPGPARPDPPRLPSWLERGR